MHNIIYVLASRSSIILQHLTSEKATSEKALVLMLVITLGTKSRFKLDDRNCLGCLAGLSNEC